MTGEEIHKWCERSRVQRNDLLLGYNEGLPAICLCETVMWEDRNPDKLHILKLNSWLNGYDGYPSHYKTEIFPVTDLTLVRATDLPRAVTALVKNDDGYLYLRRVSALKESSFVTTLGTGLEDLLCKLNYEKTKLQDENARLRDRAEAAEARLRAVRSAVGS